MNIIRPWLVFFIAVVAYGQAPHSINVFNEIVFYDGYAETVSEPTPEGVVRLSNDKYATKLKDDQLDALQKSLTIEVKIDALCDNYDRIGGVFITLVPTGEDITYADKQTIEVGRFITPFMNKNISPTQVSYEFEVNHLMGLLKSEEIRNEYDIWFELHVFGVPYAAHTQVAGCAGRDDVFAGTLNLISTSEGYDFGEFFIMPLANKIDFNNYNATDVAGTSTRIISFAIDSTINEAAFHLITSNHGANAGGEEYVRRQHHVYFNGNEVLSYKPGGKSCEPFRQYNTQGNGIYGPNPQSAAWWASWNNWCPGDKIPNRIIDLGTIEAGEHEFKITVPDAVFANNEGNFPLSLFIYSPDVQGVVSMKDIHQVDYEIYPNPTFEQVTINSSQEIMEIALYDINGKKVSEITNSNQINIAHLPASTYIAKIKFNNGIKVSENIVKINH